MGLYIPSYELTSLGNENVLVQWYSTNTRKGSEDRFCRRKLSDGQVSYWIFRNIILKRKRTREWKSVFSLLNPFFILSFSENERHIYRRNWFDLNPNYFNDKCHCSCDLSSSAYVDRHMNMQTCLRIKERSILSLVLFLLRHWDHKSLET